MPARIYALAKELNLDSKLLVDICAKAGITGKGSALASLSDEEVDQLKAYLSKSGGKKEAPAKEEAPAGQPAVAQTLRREDYIAPGGVVQKPPMLGTKETEKHKAPPKKPGDGKEGKKPPERNTRTGIRVAPMPTVEQPVPPAAPEVQYQKPDIKLPLDAIRASKAGGGKPLEAHLRKHEQKQRTESAKPKGKGKEFTPPPPLVKGGKLESERPEGKRKGKAKSVVVNEEESSPNSALGGREHRQLSRRRVVSRDDRRSEEGDENRPISVRKIVRNRSRNSNRTSTAAPRKGKVVLELPCTVRSFSESCGISARQVLGKLLGLGSMATINSPLDTEMVELLAVELGVEFELKKEKDVEDQLLSDWGSKEESAESLESRPPVVTFLGHVDHGKTSLLDRIIGIDVVSGESGGITQHIRAYRIEKDGRPIAFVDTPGHEAFTEMRARGANVTDIAVLVVAADDGVMPQTEEAISHARAAGVPIVVALNKIDLPGVNKDKIYQQLAANGLLPTEWGGDIEVVPCSALKGQGVDELLDTLLTIAELHDYKSNPNRPAMGTCIESELHEGRGVVAKLLVQNGTLNVGDVIVCGPAFGRVKAMYDTLEGRKTYEKAGPSTPVNVTGLDAAPGAGDKFYVLPDIAQAREIAEKRLTQARSVALGGGPVHVTLENLFNRLGGDQVKTLNLIVRADVRGSIEAITKEFTKLHHPEVQIKILQATVGGITEADVHLADASDAIIIGFNVVPDEGARRLAEEKGVQVRRYEIIYQITGDLKAALEGMLTPEKKEIELGRALVQRTFSISRLGLIAGCRVIAGTVERSSRVRVIRDSRVIGEYPLESLRRVKDDVREVREGLECGMKLAGFNDLKEGDILEVYRVEEVARTL